MHRIPHRTNDVLIGLVNLRGQLQLCVSLHGLLGVDAPWGLDALHRTPPPPMAPGDAGDLKDPAPSCRAPGTRLIVLRDRERSETWVFAADEVQGVQRVARACERLLDPRQPGRQLQPGDPLLEDRSVGFLDEQRVFAALRSIGQ